MLLDCHSVGGQGQGDGVEGGNQDWARSFLAVSRVETNPDKYSPSLPRLLTSVLNALAPGIGWMETSG